MQLQDVRGESAGADEGAVAADVVQQEREEQRRLLADSHSTELELRWKLQHGEKRWTRERNELLERFEKERQEWDRSLRDMHHKMEKVIPTYFTYTFPYLETEPISHLLHPRYRKTFYSQQKEVQHMSSPLRRAPVRLLDLRVHPAQLHTCAPTPTQRPHWRRRGRWADPDPVRDTGPQRACFWMPSPLTP